ncbi:peptidoglycan-binding protein [Streptomyces sp. NPDC056387]|uniref:peptidoglycan-binding domain-containing protein n=1 Tax=Streptomyces sp. NPDC056387 TaxID=3345803 RepID=UPI0035E09843
MTAVAAAVLAFGSVVTTTTAAQASTVQGYVNGFGAVGDDWSDEGVVSMSQHANSGATGLWQSVLYADGLLSATDIDCKFGPKTDAATRTWQARNLGASQADGAVGNKTFGAASSRLHYGGVNVNTDSVSYTGTAHQVIYARDLKTGQYFGITPYVTVSSSYSNGSC